MRKSPYARIREKNTTIKSYEGYLRDIASLLDCRPEITEILPAIIESKGWREDLTQAIIDTQNLRTEQESLIEKEVEKTTFNVKLENQKLQHEVARLTQLLDTKSNEVSQYKSRLIKGDKGFWDFLYKLFKLN